MNIIPKQNDDHDNRENNIGDDSSDTKVSSSKDSKTNQGGRQSRHLIPEVPPGFQPQLETQRHQRDPGAIFLGMEFTGVIDGVLPTPGGYFITIRVGNGLSLQGQAFFSSRILTQVEAGVNVSVPWVCHSPTNVDHTQENHNLNQKNIHIHNTGNQEPFIGLDINEIPPEFKVDDELLLDSLDVEMSPSLEIHISDPLPAIGKTVPVVLEPTNASTRVSIDKTKSLDKGKFILKDHYTPATKGNGICINPFSARNCQSPAIGMTPLYDLVGTTTFLTEIPPTEQCARFTQPGAGSPSLNQSTIQRVLSNTTKKVEQHQLAPLDPVAVMHPISEKNHQERVMRQQCEKGSICEQQENNIVIKLEDHQQSDDTQPKFT